LECASLSEANRSDGRVAQVILSCIASEMRKMKRGDFDRFQDQLISEGYRYQEGEVVPVTAERRIAYSKALAVTLDAPYIQAQIRRLEASLARDPTLAIGSAKEFVETCFKTILDERSISFSKSDDLPQLGKKVFQNLALISQETGDQSKGKEIIRRVLNNLASIVQGIAEIRNLYGTGHGQEGRKDELEARHAELVVGTAATLVTFLFSTHLNTPQKKASQRAPRESQPKSENLAVHGGAESGG
jgi:hypothetical protein